MKFLAIGDTHIPRRASGIPEILLRRIEDENFDLILCTGDLTDRRVLDYFERLSEVKVVRGNMDHLPLPSHHVLEVGEVKIGLIHGDQVYPRGNREQLRDIARKLGVNVLVSGHTHIPDVHFDQLLLLNPGSATGVWGGGGGSLKPSCMILEVKDRKIDVRLLELERKLLSRKWEFVI